MFIKINNSFFLIKPEKKDNCNYCPLDSNEPSCEWSLHDAPNSKANYFTLCDLFKNHKLTKITCPKEILKLYTSLDTNLYILEKEGVIQNVCFDN